MATATSRPGVIEFGRFRIDANAANSLPKAAGATRGGAATSLARLWGRESPTRARRLVARVVRRFTEGFEAGLSAGYVTETLHRAGGAARTIQRR